MPSSANEPADPVSVTLRKLFNNVCWDGIGNYIFWVHVLGGSKVPCGSGVIADCNRRAPREGKKALLSSRTRKHPGRFLLETFQGVGVYVSPSEKFLQKTIHAATMKRPFFSREEGN